MPDFSKRYNQNEIVTDYDAQRAAMAGRVLPVRHGGSRPSINTSKFETEYQNFIKKLKEQKAQEQAQEAIVETVEEPVVEAPKPKKKKSKVVLNDVITETSEEAEAAITEKVEEQPELPTFDLD